MRAELHQIERDGPGILSIMARPRGGEWLVDEIRAWRAVGVDLVVSLLTPAEQTELGLDDEATVCERAHLTFLAFPIADRGIPPQLAVAERVIDEVVRALHSAKHVAIHCRAGIGRSAMLAAAALVALGETPERALASIQTARGLPVPDTSEQRQWVTRYAMLRSEKAVRPRFEDTP